MTAHNASRNTISASKQFPIGSSVVYPKHGVGTVVGIQKNAIHGTSVELMTIRFEKDRMTIQVPIAKVTSSGVRNVASLSEMGEALKTLISKKKTRRKLWSRRAQEYEAKINSGEINALAEVVRDLFRKVDHVNQSYSERQLYQTALERLAREVAAVRRIDEKTASDQLETMMFEQQVSDNEEKDEEQVAVA